MLKQLRFGLQLGVLVLVVVGMYSVARYPGNLERATRPVQAAISADSPSCADVVKGTQAMTSDGLERVMNPRPIANDRVTYEYGDICSVTGGSTVTAVGCEDGKVLVRYTQLANEPRFNCPSGTLYFVFVHEFVGMTDEYLRRQNEEAARPDMVRRLLEAEQN